MHIQRKSPPGNQNLTTSVLCNKENGWYSKLLSREQHFLNDPCVIISSDPIPEDLVNDVSRSDITSFSKISHIDRQNSAMFHDKSMDSILFQQKIHQFRFIHSCNKQTQWKQLNNINTNKRSFDRNILQEVPSINYLREQVKLFTDGLNITQKNKQPESWNSMFHQICSLCNLEYEFPPWAIPSCYSKHQICEHIQQVNLDKAATNSLYLAALDNMSNSTSTHFPLSVAAMFIQSVVYENPV